MGGSRGSIGLIGFRGSIGLIGCYRRWKLTYCQELIDFLSDPFCQTAQSAAATY